MVKISFLVFTRNSENEIGFLLRDVAGIVDEVIVVDGFSNDHTVEIARSNGARVFSRRPIGYPDPDRKFAFEQINYDWVLYLDTDEKLGSKLKASIRDLVEKADRDGIAAYSIMRFDLTNKGVPLFGPFPHYQTRIFRKSRVLYRGIVHEPPQVFGQIRRLPEDFYLLHVPGHSMRKYALYAYLEKMSMTRDHGDLWLGKSWIESILWALAPLSTLGVYLTCVLISTREKHVNLETLLYTLPFAVYRGIAYTMMKTRTKSEEMAAREIFQRGVRKVS